MLVFASSIGFATFIENDYGTMAAKSLIFNSWWLELCLLLLCAIFVYNIFQYNLYKVRKIREQTEYQRFYHIKQIAGK